MISPEITGRCRLTCPSLCYAASGPRWTVSTQPGSTSPGSSPTLTKRAGVGEAVAGLPPSADALCRYGAEWTATKLRWGLAVDEAERDRLLDIAAGCGGTDVEFTPAP
ncbi:hypothetical protein [Streptomyces sp. A0592]|uniref:hypothetical protein n=1 Tax=Streptomyces sp. A0592 TaxID=2563099 RepID=UPI0019CFBA3E|nr:hypothetical protein [Streptomyces sp. A0592]